MDIGLGLPTHGVLRRHGDDTVYEAVDFREMALLDIACRAEELGFHSVWFPDHVAFPQRVRSRYPVNQSGNNGYPPRPSALDTVAAMAAVAARTHTIRLGSSVLIAPYRHPLGVARAFATLDVLSNGRTIFGVSAGWMKEEFDALGVDFAKRGAITDECLEICRLAWSEGVCEFHGAFFDFDPVSVDPTPVQTPGPPVVYGASSIAGARRAGHRCDGIYPMFVDPLSKADQYEEMLDALQDEARRRGRSLATFQLLALAGAHMKKDGARRVGFMRGSPPDLREDLEALAASGFSHCTIEFEAPSGGIAEFRDQVEQFASEVLPGIRQIQARRPEGWS